LLIGKLSELTGVNIETIRYYERIELLAKPDRTTGRQRAYAGFHVGQLRLIRRCRELGFPIATIATLMRLSNDPTLDYCAIKDLAMRHLVDVRSKIDSLQNLEQALEKMTTACQPEQQSTCPILDALNTDPPLMSSARDCCA
jgi:MerR family transcriptional regulator, mercuric resistance operon regulatory protein